MPRVSILIPAFKPDYFDQCVQSALAQTFQDFEIIVSDDCLDDGIVRALGKWDDPRIRYLRNPTPNIYASNRDNLLRHAAGQYVKFLYDDDYLYPQSIERLLQAIEVSGAKLAFHHRHHVDSAGRVLAAEAPFGAGQICGIPPDFLYANLIAQSNNFIGEPTTTLFETQAFRDLRQPYGALGRHLRFLDDVALYRAFARAGHLIAAVADFQSAFRIHGQQNSNAASPIFSAGLFEWEVLLRDAIEEGRISQDQYRRGLELVHGRLLQNLRFFPELRAFLDLAGEPEGGSYAGPAYAEALDLAYLCVDLRRNRSFAPGALPS